MALVGNGRHRLRAIGNGNGRQNVYSASMYVRRLGHTSTSNLVMTTDISGYIFCRREVELSNFWKVYLYSCTDLRSITMEKRRYNSPIPALAEIPVVDFDGVFSCADLTSCPQTAQIHSAFTTVGFVFIKNHGIHRKLVRVNEEPSV